MIALAYMAAGTSSRFGGKIKGFTEVGSNGETLVEYSLNQSLSKDVAKIVFIVSNATRAAFQERFRDSYKGVPVFYALQDFDDQTRSKPWGTADALVSAKEFLDIPFIICNSDDLYGRESFRILTSHLLEKDYPATIGFELGKNIPHQGLANRGIFTAQDGYVSALREVIGISRENLSTLGLSEKDLCSMNLFALQPFVVELLKKSVNDFKVSHRGDTKAECLLPAELSSFIVNGAMKMKIFPSTSKCVGVTAPGDEHLVRKFLLENRSF